MYTSTVDYFAQIAQVPRMSKKEDKIRAWLLAWAKERNFSTQSDTIGNLVITVPWTAGRENDEIIVLQAHMDMVCVKDPESSHNFDTDAIEIVMKGEWMFANKTTLWADNGMGLAMCLAAAELESHPPLEILVTVDEEQGMSWVLQLDETMLSWKKLINLDTEDEWEVCISSSGGARVDVLYPIERTEASGTVVDFILKWMQGGHSGVDIHKNRWSAIMLRCLAVQSYSGVIGLLSIEGWVADNAIPGRCKGVVAVDDQQAFTAHVAVLVDWWKQEYDCPDCSFGVTAGKSSLWALSSKDAVLSAIAQVPFGVHAMSDKIEGLVQTSVNLWMISSDEESVSLTYAPRSSVMSELEWTIQLITSTHEAQWATVNVRSQYPGWQEDPSNELVQHVAEKYGEVLWYTPEIVAYHAWLECGALVEKLGEWAQAVSFGPTIKNPHSPVESCHMPSVEKCCLALEKILA